MMDSDLAQAVEVAQEVFPFWRRRAVLAQEIVEMLLHCQRQKGAEDMTANGGVG